MHDQATRNIEDIAKNRELRNLAKSAISEIRLSKKSLMQYLFSALIALILSYSITYKSDTVPMMKNAIEVVNTGALAFIAIIFGTYAIFQALMTDSVIWVLISSEGNLLNTSNRSFLHLILLYLAEIISNFVLLIVLNGLPNDYCLFENLIITNALAFVLITIYFMYCFMLFYEVKNFAVNLYQMFNIYNICKALEILEKKLEEDFSDNEKLP